MFSFLFSLLSIRCAKQNIARGFTFIELITTLSIVSVLSGIAIPNFSDFIIKMRVDNEISQLFHLLLIARNTAINTHFTVTVCPLDTKNKCIDNWQQSLSAFIDTNANKIYEPNLGERILFVKDKIRANDKLNYGIKRTGVIYSPSGRLAAWGSNGTFRYCPFGHSERNRGIRVATSGRLYVSHDTDHDNKDEDRSNNELKSRH